MMNSVWSTSVEFPRFPRLEGDIRTDVLIVGGGIAGILCAMEMRRRGIDCVLIESRRLCHGVTGNTTAKLTSQHGLLYHKIAKKYGDERAYLYWQINQDAISRYRILAETHPCDLENKSSYVYSLPGSQAIKSEMDTLDRLGIPAELTVPSELPFSDTEAIHFPDQAQFHPLKLLSQVAANLNIFEETAAKAFSPHEVVTDLGTIHAEKMVLTTHFPILNKHGAFFLKMYQDRSYVLAAEGAGHLDGMYLDPGKEGLSFRSYGDLLLIGCGSHRTGKRTEGWAKAEQFLQTYYPDAKIRYRWAAQDCMTLDGIPYIGQYSRHTPDLYTATGFNKWGMTTSMAAASVLADLIQGKENPCEELFSPDRSMLHPRLLLNGLEAAGSLLRFSRPRCPHMGCALKWNPLERSWDCPCHGSRFSGDGTLEDGPATADLKIRRSE